MVKKRIKLIAFSVFMVLIMLVATAGPALAEPPKIRVLIGFNKNLISNNQRDNNINMLGGRIKRKFKRISVISAELPPKAIAALKSLRGISFVEEDGEVFAVAQDTPWGITRVNAPTVFPTNKGTGIKVLEELEEEKAADNLFVERVVEEDHGARERVSVDVQQAAELARPDGFAERRDELRLSRFRHSHQNGREQPHCGDRTAQHAGLPQERCESLTEALPQTPRRLEVDHTDPCGEH